jgi:hypothetical protein
MVLDQCRSEKLVSPWGHIAIRAQMVVHEGKEPLGLIASGVPRNFFQGVPQIQLRTEGRENGDLGAVAP